MFDRDFSIVKWHGRVVTFFPENFERLNISSKKLEIYIKCHERLTWSQNLWIQSTFLPEYKLYDHGYLPCPYKIPIQSYFGHNIFFFHPISKIFAAHSMTNLCLNIGKKIFYLIICKLKIIQENAFSEVSFSTLVLVHYNIMLETLTWHSIQLEFVFNVKTDVSPATGVMQFCTESQVLVQQRGINSESK